MSVEKSAIWKVAGLLTVLVFAVFGTGEALCTNPIHAAAGEDESADGRPTIRINAGAYEKYTDSDDNVWLADEGFEGGETISRSPDMKIENTKDPDLYRTERYSMESFSYELANGKYEVRLHFAETYEGVTGPGDRVFSFNVQGQEFKDFDVYVKAEGVQRAYVETVKVDVTDGKLSITFTPQVQNPEINGIEIIPAAEKPQ